jgi:hypothetical protein
MYISTYLNTVEKIAQTPQEKIYKREQSHIVWRGAISGRGSQGASKPRQTGGKPRVVK